MAPARGRRTAAPTGCRNRRDGGDVRGARLPHTAADADTAEVEDSTAEVEDLIVALDEEVLDVGSVVLEVGFSLALAPGP